MKFLIYATALNGKDSDLALIDRLVDRFAEEVHRVDLPEADLLESSRWFESARQTRQKILMSAVARPPRAASGDRGPHLKVLNVYDTESARLADRLAHTPLILIVEDRESDGAFIDIIVEELGWPELQALWAIGKQVTPRSAEIETAGGKGAIPQRIERAIRDAREENRSHRLFVLCDSDARWPGDANAHSSREEQAVQEACVKHGVPHHTWRKRSAESYIPDEVFEEIRDTPNNINHVDRFNALLRRSPKQRDHFPVKGGLKVAERKEAMQAGLYNTSEEKDLELLEKSLLQSRPRPLAQLSVQMRTAFTAKGLRARDGGGELDELLHAIAQEL